MGDALLIPLMCGSTLLEQFWGSYSFPRFAVLGFAKFPSLRRDSPVPYVLAKLYSHIYIHGPTLVAKYSADCARAAPRRPWARDCLKRRAPYTGERSESFRCIRVLRAPHPAWARGTRLSQASRARKGAAWEDPRARKHACSALAASSASDKTRGGTI
eukprot:SAG22_NODE_1432_length_4436_cov_4.264007_1_plen_158_part_00